MNKIGILTWHYYKNFGSALQAYALQETLKKIGCQPQIINYRNPKFGKEDKIKNYIKLLLNKFGFEYNLYFEQFWKKYMNQTRLIQSKDQLSQIAKEFNSIICGSDQIWAPNVFNPIYMLDFVQNNNVRRISYAASIGLNYLPQDLKKTYKNLLSKFNMISVREKTGQELLEKECGIHSQVVLDPTLLISRKEWEKIVKKPKEVSKNFIFCYFLNENHKYKEKVKKFAQKYDLQIFGFTTCSDDYKWMTKVEKIGPCEFLWYIQNSEYVFTDSYHGTIFSLIFYKKFITFERFNSSDKICQNSRLEQLSLYFNLKDNIVSIENYNIQKINLIDYNKFNLSLCDYQEKSLNFLKGVLS